MRDLNECPDGGTCHHHCASGCFRVRCCEPLSGVYPFSQWPWHIKIAPPLPKQHDTKEG